MIRTTICAAAILAGPAFAEEVTYDVEGVEHTGYFAAAESPRGLVIIVHDWDGMNEYERERADMLAGMGYDAFALDMYGADTEAGSFELNRAASGELYGDREKMRGLIRAGLDTAAQQSDAGAPIMAGYCFGGGVILEMARSEMAGEASGYASFHGSYGTPEGQSYGDGLPPLLFLHGAADEVATTEQLVSLMGELSAVDATYTTEIYSGAPHAFSVMGSDSYRERAATESWETFSDFLEMQTAG